MFSFDIIFAAFSAFFHKKVEKLNKQIQPALRMCTPKCWSKYTTPEIEKFNPDIALYMGDDEVINLLIECKILIKSSHLMKL